MVVMMADCWVECLVPRWAVHLVASKADHLGMLMAVQLAVSLAVEMARLRAALKVVR